MAVIITNTGMPKCCGDCEYDGCNLWHYHSCIGTPPDDCPVKSVDGLIAKILEEVDGGTDDMYIRYTDIVDRVTQSVKEYCGNN